MGQINQRRSWALVLSGGGGKGLAHLGVLKALFKRGLYPDLIVGTSMGAIVGGLTASGVRIKELEYFLVHEFNIGNYMEGLSFRLSSHLPIFRFLQAGEALNAALTQPGLDKGSKIRQLFRSFTEGKDIEDSPIPFACNAVSLNQGHEVVLDKGPMEEAIYASMAFPGVFAPLNRQGHLLVDGSVINNLPTWIPKLYGIERTIAVNVAQLDYYPQPGNAMEILFRAFFVATENHVLNRQIKGDMEITLANKVSSFDFSQGRILVNLGMQAVKERLEEIYKLIYST